MNAYEIADGLKKMYIETDIYGLFNRRIQVMLRQQADKITMLEQECAAMREQLSYLESQVYGGITK